MKRLLSCLALLAACDEPLAGDNGIGNGNQPGCGVPSECEAEVMRNTVCLQTACDTQYRNCYGPDYASKIYNGGPCSAWQSCIDRCGCDAVCQTSCGQAPLTCLDCVGGPLQACTINAQCAPAQCIIDAGNNNVGACNRLSLCCGTLRDQGQRAQCTTLHQNLSPAGDDVCAGVIPAFCP